MLKSVYKAAIAAAAISALVGCVTPPPETFDPLEFDEAEYSALPSTGTGVIRGQVFARRLDGGVVKGAGEGVVILPATKYGTQRYQEQVLGGKLASHPVDKRYSKNVVLKVADGDGRFEFRDVPPGKYYVFSSVTWMVPDGGRLVQQGGRVSTQVEVKNGEVSDAMLSR